MNTSKSLDAYHLHSCRSRQAWVKGMTKPFPCDCGLGAAIVEAVEGLVGEDEPIYDEPKLRSLEVDNPLREARNELRAELRQAIKEWQ